MLATHESHCHFGVVLKERSKLTLDGLADEIEGLGVKACIVCETPAASTNSSRNSVLVFPRALKKIKLVAKFNILL
jgi:hypothetical protein